MRKLIGNKQFYLMVLAVAVPIMIQNGITNFVGLLDNVMVGQIGTEQMSGVAITNQLMFVFNICIFGGVSGAGIFAAQFFGSGDHEGARNAFRIKIVICLFFLFVGLLLFAFYGEPLIQLYLSDNSDPAQSAATLYYARRYMLWMMLGMFPFVLEQAYSSTLRENEETVLPMKAGIVAVLVNLVLNYLLIFGKFGFPKLGVEGAAIATVISRFIECTIIIVWTHRHSKKHRFITGAYRNFRVPKDLVLRVIKKGAPLTINEILWATAQATLMKCYAVRGLSVIAGMNISSTISNVFNIVFIAMGSAVAIIVGQLLGANKMDEARDTAGKLIAFSVACCVVIGCIMAAFSPLFPKAYNTTDEVRSLATAFIIVSAICMPLYAFMHATYFTLRSGGKTVITFLFDSGFAWVISIPLAYILSRYTAIPIILLYFICQFVEIIKCVIGYILLRKGVWLHNIIIETKIE